MPFDVTESNVHSRSSISESEDHSAISNFLNLLFNNLNWTVTEFLVALKEIETAAKNRFVHLSVQSVIHRSLLVTGCRSSSDLRELQRKCNITFELATFLFRIIEILTYASPWLFLRGLDINLSRLCEILLHVINQVTVGKHSVLFEAIVQLKLPGLDKLSRAAILDPFVGVVMNLHLNHSCDSQTRDSEQALVFATKLASYDSFNFDNFEYLSNFACCRALQRDSHYTESQVALAFADLRESAIRRHLLVQAHSEVPEEFLDPITCALMDNPVRLPTSGKVMDHSVIARHLLSDAKDPFNRAPLTIDDVIPDDDLKQRITIWKLQ